MGYKNKNDMNTYLKEKYYRLKKAVFNLLGNKCAQCGETEGLQIDHKDKTLKKYNVLRQLRCKPWAIILKEVEKCQLLCKKCHLEKTKKEFDRYGEKNSSAKLKNEDVEEIRNFIKQGLSYREIGKMYGVSNVSISNIKNNKTWKIGRAV